MVLHKKYMARRDLRLNKVESPACRFSPHRGSRALWVCRERSEAVSPWKPLWGLLSDLLGGEVLAPPWGENPE